MDISLTCQTCNKIFKSKNTLMRHIKKPHTASNRYECRICNEDFSQKRKLRRHYKRNHEHGNISTKTQFEKEVDTAFERCFEVFDMIVYGNTEKSNNNS